LTAARLKRLARLEARKPSAKPWVDCSPWAIPYLLALLEGRPYTVVPLPDVERSEEAEQAYRRCMQEADRTAARFEQADPGCAARFQADVERKRAAIMKALEREQAARAAA
jgi:hypothetical protein